MTELPNQRDERLAQLVARAYEAQRDGVLLEIEPADFLLLFDELRTTTRSAARLEMEVAALRAANSSEQTTSLEWSEPDEPSDGMRQCDASVGAIEMVVTEDMEDIEGEVLSPSRFGYHLEIDAIEEPGEYFTTADAAKAAALQHAIKWTRELLAELEEHADG